MGLKPLQITFELDPAGIIYDPYCPIHLDSLIDWALSPMVRIKSAPSRNELPEEIRLPLGTWHIGGAWGWCASALLPIEEDYEEGVQFFRKKFRANRVSLCDGMPNLQSGPTRDYNQPYTTIHIDTLVAYALGNRHRIHDLLRRNLRYLAKKRRRGRGRIENMTVEVVEHDWSVTKNGRAMRWLPDPNGLREVRPRPPYWNNVGRIPCCEVGSFFNGDVNGL